MNKKLHILILSTLGAAIASLTTTSPTLAQEGSLTDGRITFGGSATLFTEEVKNIIRFDEAVIDSVEGVFAGDGLSSFPGIPLETGVSVQNLNIEMPHVLNNPLVNVESNPVVTFTAEDVIDTSIGSDLFEVEYRGVWTIEEFIVDTGVDSITLGPDFEGGLLLSSENNSFSASGSIDPFLLPQDDFFPSQQIPEPMTILGSALVLGISSYMKYQQQKTR